VIFLIKILYSLLIKQLFIIGSIKISLICEKPLSRNIIVMIIVMVMVILLQPRTRL